MKRSIPHLAHEPGSTLRVGIVNPETGAHSTVWRIWTNKHKDDVYIAARPTAGVMKVSLHASALVVGIHLR